MIFWDILLLLLPTRFHFFFSAIAWMSAEEKCYNFAIMALVLLTSEWLKSFAERTDVSYPPMIETINLLEPSADFLAPGDRIHQVDGVSTVGLSNDQVMNLLLCNREENTVIEIEYSLPEYSKYTIKYDWWSSEDKFPPISYHQCRKTACASPQNWHRLPSKERTAVSDWHYVEDQRCRSLWQTSELMDRLTKRVALSLAIACCALTT